MRKLLIVAILAIPTILVTPAVTSARHCCFPCVRPCWSPCFHGPCFHGGCFHGPFCGFGFRTCGFVSVGYYPSYYWPGYYYNYSPYPYSVVPYYPFAGTTFYAPSSSVATITPGNDADGMTRGTELRIGPRTDQPSATSLALPAPSRATVVVVLPAEARLSANGQRLSTTSDRRTFATPELTPGKAFQYTFTAEVMRDGKMVAQTKKVQVRAGEETELTFEFPPAVAARK